MSFIIKHEIKGGSFVRQLPKDDTQLGVIQQIIDLGLHTDTYGKTKQRLMITFELPDDLIEEGEHKGKPLVISREYPVSLGEAKGRKADLRILIDAAEGRVLSNVELQTYDLEKIIGKGVYLTIIHKPKKSEPNEMVATITGVTKLPKSVKAPTLVTDPIIFNLAKPDLTVLDKLHPWIKKKINLEGVELPSTSGDF